MQLILNVNNTTSQKLQPRLPTISFHQLAQASVRNVAVGLGFSCRVVGLLLMYQQLAL